MSAPGAFNSLEKSLHVSWLDPQMKTQLIEKPGHSVCGCIMASQNKCPEDYDQLNGKETQSSQEQLTPAGNRFLCRPSSSWHRR